MRFTVAAAVLATSVSAQVNLFTDAPVSTAYTTQLITITACPETVTDCPARSTTVSTAVVPVTTSTIYATHVHTITACAAEVIDCPAHSTIVSTETIAISTTVCPVTATATPIGGWNGTAVVPPAGPTGTGALPLPALSYTTVLTSVEYSTVEVPCPTAPAGNPPPPASGTGVPPPVFTPPAGNGTVPPPVNGAAAFSGSALLAAAAGVVALILA
ncbi:hypothetical protein PT974_08197 [Cladobotryum mycophilum]|uniref:GPI anchored serine-rich protein n=1 Tax=Cladobotryum mycophilum TaxID=491253 RepID=A0ABR0SCQ4_9HYPO